MESYVTLALETSGDNPFCHCILQISALKFKNGQPGDSLVLTIKPYEVPDYDEINEAIPNSLLAATLSGMNINEAYIKLMTFIANEIVVMHDAVSIIRFLSSSQRDKVFMPPYVDTLSLAKRYYPDLPKYNIEAISKHLDIDKYYFNSMPKAWVTGQLLFEIMVRF